MCESNDERVLDLKTPRNIYLSAFYKRSFAFHTVKNRMPVISTQLIDGLVRSKDQIVKQYGPEAKEELKEVIGEISKLKYEIQTNKPLRHLTSDASDVKFYNDYITEQAGDDGTLTFFGCIWLLAECYMYRRIREAFELTEHLKDFDPFQAQKEAAFQQSLIVGQRLAEHLLPLLKSEDEAEMGAFVQLLKGNLWGNKCDLSLSNGVLDSKHEQLFDISNLEPDLICDHSERIWHVIKADTSDVVDIVFDNAGYELFTDLCLADYITTKGLAKKVRFYVKTIPWFISDVMLKDLNWTLDRLIQHKDKSLQALAERWIGYIKNKTWIVFENEFWTLPVDFTYMKTTDEKLYRQLAEAKLVIFKGDLNYRKLFGEKNWDPTTSVEEALQGFHPTKLCSLRTVKSDIVAGITQEIFDELEEKDPKWMETGTYGLIQLSEKVLPL